MDAIYARQSVDRPDSISIESQIDFCQYETRGRPFQTYIDRGYSGKNTQRPGFQSMMRDMEAGLVQRVIVYKLDRISRSILDFSAMMERFGHYGVAFVSTTEKFDTDSPMGRAMLNICIVFAQLERETIQKRVADAYFTRSRKSFYMGGRTPYGYQLTPTVISGVKTSMYQQVAEEAETVLLIYQLYAKPECSYGDILSDLQIRGITKRGKPWVRSRLADILRSPVYVRADRAVYRFFQEQGAEVVNPPEDFIGTNGCYCYRSQDSGNCGDLRGRQLVLAPHQGIVPAELWLQCRRKSLAQRTHGLQKAKNTWLAGKIKCGLCGYALVDKHYAGSPRRYLVCSHRMDAKACPGPGTLHTEELEELVRGELQKKLSLFPCLRQGQEASPELAAWRLALEEATCEISSLMDRLAAADQVLSRYISNRICVLDARIQELRENIAWCSSPEGGRAIYGHLTRWEELSFTDKRRTVNLLIQTIYATSDTVRIEWRL